MGKLQEFKKMLTEGRLGFLMNEVMTGTHQFVDGAGPAGDLFMEFKVTWGNKHVSKFFNPLGKEFFRNTMSGKVTIEGLVQDAELEGKLELLYFTEAKLKYSFNFRGPDGREYTYKGEKRDLRPWNLHRTHMTLYGTVTETDTGRLISNSILYFKLKTMPTFLASFRLA